MSLILSAEEVSDLRERHDEKLVIRYSGRGMFGATCVGYVGDDLILFAFDLALATAGLDRDDPIMPSDLRDELEHIGAPYSDSMGMDTIWYWTRVTVAEDVDDDPDTEPDDNDDPRSEL